MFMESIEEFNHGKKNMTLTYETIENLYVSPAVKERNLADTENPERNTESNGRRAKTSI